MSTHSISVVAIEEIRTHPNADLLDLARVKGYWSVVKRDEYVVGDLCVFIPPDYLVPLNCETFEFLKPRAKEGAEYLRIKAMRLRGENSWGLIVPSPPGALEGTELMQEWGILRYEPVEGGSTGDNEHGPDLFAPTYSLNHLQDHLHKLSVDDEVIVTGKIHGQNGRFVWHDGRMYCGSHRRWKYPPGHVLSENHVAPATNWWTCLRQNPWIEDFCKAHPDVVLYGEVYGPGVQGPKFHYGLKPQQYGFVVFDVLKNGAWLSNQELMDNEEYAPLHKVEVLYRGRFDFEKIKELAELKESFNSANHIREGVVLKKAVEDPNSLCRIAFKYVSIQYYTKGS